MQIVTIKHPLRDADSSAEDSSDVGAVHDVSPHLAILMIAAGWVRPETRFGSRRQIVDCHAAARERRRVSDRRSHAA